MVGEDLIFRRWLETQQTDVAALEAESDSLSVFRCGNPPYQQYRAAFRCGGLVRTPGGQVVRADHFEVLITFPEDYLRRADPFEVVAWLGPPNVWHPNIAPPAACVGRLVPGTRLVDIIYQMHEIITFRKATMNEFDVLNHSACQWARDNTRLFPVDNAPLKRRSVGFEVEPDPGGR